jgi:hypothetical protein
VSRGGALLAAAATAVLLFTIAAAMLTEQPPADASTLSLGSRGWLVARRYLEEKGATVTLLDDEPETPVEGVLVVAFPWQRLAFHDALPMIDRHLQQGGTVLFAYSGHLYAPFEEAIAARIALERQPLSLSLSEDPPLNPFEWRKYASREWSLTLEFEDAQSAPGSRPVRIDAPERAFRAPKGATVLLRGPSGEPVAFAFPRAGGRVIAVPADALSNARIGEPGNADLLERLRETLGDAWSFDEFHHGLTPPPSPAERGPQRVLSLYVLQIAFVYVLVVLAVARRFGPSWREPPVASGSSASFLLGLGALHERLGHQRAASRLLVSRAREFDPRLRLEDPRETEEADLLAIARRVARAQSGKVRDP